MPKSVSFKTIAPTIHHAPPIDPMRLGKLVKRKFDAKDEAGFLQTSFLQPKKQCVEQNAPFSLDAAIKPFSDSLSSAIINGYKTQGFDAVFGETFKDLELKQKKERLPLIIAQCNCFVHQKLGTDAALIDHPQFVDGSRLYNYLFEHDLAARGLSKKDEKTQESELRDQRISNFAKNNFVYYAVNVERRKADFILSKQRAALADRNMEIMQTAILYSNHINEKNSLDVGIGLCVAAMYFTGYKVRQDKMLAVDAVQRLQNLSLPHAEAEALLAAVYSDEPMILKALLDLGLDPHQEDEDGFSAFDAMNRSKEEKISNLIRKIQT